MRGHRLVQNDEALTQGWLVEELKDPRQVLRPDKLILFRSLHFALFPALFALLFVVAALVWRSLWLYRLPYLVRAQ
jgi:hypothetical protein